MQFGVRRGVPISLDMPVKVPFRPVVFKVQADSHEELARFARVVTEKSIRRFDLVAPVLPLPKQRPTDGVEERRLTAHVVAMDQDHRSVLTDGKVDRVLAEVGSEVLDFDITYDH